jgi:hypothetical protein
LFNFDKSLLLVLSALPLFNVCDVFNFIRI